MTESDDARRLERLEETVAELRRELADVRDVLRTMRDAAPNAAEARARPEPRGAVDVTAPIAPEPPRDARPAAVAMDARGGIDLGALRRPLEGQGLEDLVGRYGTVALAALLILMGVGAFLTWAVARFTLSPASRVALGAMLAIVLAIVGLRLRARDGADDDGGATGARRFGDTLLAIALAVVHVDAWGAGPYLGLVPSAVALAMAAAASAALAALAWKARQQALFVVGVGGALVAPFVAGSDRGHPFVLAAYGFIVLATAAAALPRRDDEPAWGLAATTLALGGALFASTMMGDATAIAAVGNPADIPLPTWTARRDLPALFALATGVATLALGGRVYRARVALAHVATALVTLAVLALSVAGGAPSLVALAGVGTVVAYAALESLHPRAPRTGLAHLVAVRVVGATDARVQYAFGAVAYPLGFLFGAVVALVRPLSPTGAALGALWAALAAAMSWRTSRRVGRPPAVDAPRGDVLDRTLGDVSAHVATSLLASALVPLLLLREHDVAQAAALAVHAIVGALVLARVRHGVVAAAVAAELAFASALAWALLAGRPAYRYTPFLTAESLAAAACVAGWTALAWATWRAWLAPRDDATDDDATGDWRADEPWRALFVASAPVAALVWGREELARAVSPEVSTFLLVGFFAAAGIASIWVGRTRAISPARLAGLALAVYAALKALVQAAALDAVGLKVGSYLLVGCFLLAVGWWYRGERVERA